MHVDRIDLEPRAFAERVHDEMLTFADLHTVFIRTPAGHASGACVRIADRYFVATCAHALRSARDVEDMHVLTAVPSPWHAPRLVNFGVSHLDEADRVDVGWIEIHPDIAGDIGRWFVSLDAMCLATVHPADAMYVCGFPDEQTLPTRFEGTKGTKSRTIGYSCAAIVPPGADLAHDVYVDYPVEVSGPLPRGYQRRCPIPKGVSGGGMWRPRWHAQPWSIAEVRLVGLQRSWSEANRWLRGTRIEHWLRMVGQDLPELAGEIDRILAGVRS